MVRIFAIIVGLVFSGVALLSMGADAWTYFQSPPEESVEHEFHREPKKLALQSDGPFGTYDKAQLQRGLQVYTEVCAGCHGISRVSFFDLDQIGYTPGQVKSFAANEWKIEVPTINPDTGEPATRKALPSDKFPSPYPNEIAARAANNNALPPDLSLMAKARPDGANYIYSLLTGYQQPPAEVRRAVWKRDGGRCTYVSPDGVRCGSRWQLEPDHIEPVALGGTSRVEDLTLRCRPHNLLRAEQVFGRAFMDRYRREPVTIAGDGSSSG